MGFLPFPTEVGLGTSVGDISSNAAGETLKAAGVQVSHELYAIDETPTINMRYDAVVAALSGLTGPARLIFCPTGTAAAQEDATEELMEALTTAAEADGAPISKVKLRSASRMIGRKANKKGVPTSRFSDQDICASEEEFSKWTRNLTSDGRPYWVNSESGLYTSSEPLPPVQEESSDYTSSEDESSLQCMARIFGGGQCPQQVGNSGSDRYCKGHVRRQPHGIIDGEWLGPSSPAAQAEAAAKKAAMEAKRAQLAKKKEDAAAKKRQKREQIIKEYASRRGLDWKTVTYEDALGAV